MNNRYENASTIILEVRWLITILIGRSACGVSVTLLPSLGGRRGGGGNNSLQHNGAVPNSNYIAFDNAIESKRDFQANYVYLLECCFVFISAFD